MNEDLDKKSILDMAMGAIQERVDYEMGRVLDNILDVNTRAVAKRKITVSLELLPDASRKVITVSATAKAALVPTEPVTTSLYITATPGNGEMAVVEMVPQVPGQIGLAGDQQEEPKILKFVKQA